MKYYIFGKGGVGISYDGNLPEGSLEISEDVYNNPIGYYITNGKLHVPTEKELKEIQEEALIRENLGVAEAYYSSASAEITAIEDRLADQDYKDDSEKTSLESLLSSWRSYRITIRNYISQGNNTIPPETK